MNQDNDSYLKSPTPEIQNTDNESPELTNFSKNQVTPFLMDVEARRQLLQSRIRLFWLASITGLIVVCSLVYLFHKTISVYLSVIGQWVPIQNSDGLPVGLTAEITSILGSFWHIPLMIAFMTTSILFVILRLSSAFGLHNHDNLKADSEKTSLTDDYPILKETLNTVRTFTQDNKQDV